MNRNVAVALAAALVVGLGAGYLLGGPGDATDAPGSAAHDERRPLFYRNPMNPAITSPVPAKDEMGMDYLPVYAGGGSGGNAPAGTVSIDPVVTQNIGVRTAEARRTILSREIRTVGRIDFDEKRVARLHPKVEGWIEELFVDETGARVGRDTMLLSLYSPQLVATEEEYLLALANAEALKDSSEPDIREGAARLATAARERLVLLDVPDHQLAALDGERKVIKNLHIHSPFAGTVISIGARAGERVTPMTELYTIADLTRIWVYVDIYEDEMPWVRTGDRARMTVAGVPGRTFEGSVAYVYPYLDPKSRTNKLRLEFENPDLTLKPEMFAQVTLEAGRQVDAVTVPSEAIVRTGAREQVFVVRGEGKYEPRTVTVGVESGGRTQIVSGVEAGERVVVSAQFLIDSESKLNEATAKLLEPGGGDTAAPPPMDDNMDMSGMDMGDMNMEGMTLEKTK